MKPTKKNLPLKASEKDELKFSGLVSCKNTHTEVVNGLVASVSLELRVYSGLTEAIGAIHAMKREVIVKAFGLYVIQTLDFTEEIPYQIRKGKLSDQGFGSSRPTQLTRKKDFGYLTAQSYEAHYLVHRLSKSDVLHDWDLIDEYIAEEVDTWGIPVVGDDGKFVYSSKGQVKRNPFAQAAKLALRQTLSREHNAAHRAKLKLAAENTPTEGVDE